MDQEKQKDGVLGFEVRGEATELLGVLDGLGAALEAAPRHVRDLALNLFDYASEFVSVQEGVTDGAGVTVMLEPSQWLRDLVAAVRAGDLEWLAVQRTHKRPR